MSFQIPTILVNGKKKEYPYRAKTRPYKARASHIPLSRWESYRPVIEHLYHLGTLRDLMETMEQEYGFSATKAQYSAQLSQWGLSKNKKRVLGKSSDSALRDGSTGSQFSHEPRSCEPERPVLHSEKIPATDLDSMQFGHFANFKILTRDKSQDSGYGSNLGERSEDLVYDHPSTKHLSADEIDHRAGSLFLGDRLDAKVCLGAGHWLEPYDQYEQSMLSCKPSHHSILGEHPDDLAPDHSPTRHSRSNSWHGSEDWYNFGNWHDPNAPAKPSVWQLPRRDTALQLDLEDPSFISDQTCSEEPRPIMSQFLKTEVSQNDRKLEPLYTGVPYCQRVSQEPWGVVCDEAKRLIDESPQIDFHTLNVNGTSPSHIVGHRCSAGVLPASTPSPTLPGGTRAGSLVPPGEDIEEDSDLTSDESSDRSVVSSNVDILADLCRGALDRFLNWVNECYMPQLLLEFQEKSLLLPSESSFRSCTTRNTSPGSRATPSDSTLSSSQNVSNSSGKRKMTAHNGPAAPGVQDSEQVLEPPTARRRKNSKLACHFNKRNPGKFSRGRYKTCPLGFDGLNRLKDHQKYVHRPEHYCKRCKLIFKSHDEKDAHEDQDVRCERREDPDFDDYLTTDEQRDALAKKKPVGVKEEDFWFEMWDKYFTGKPRPQSPFQDLDPTLVAFQSFAEHQTLTTIQAYYQYSPEHGLTVEELTEFWHFAIYYVVANFATQQRLLSSSFPAPAPSSQRQQRHADFLELEQMYQDNPNSTYPDLNPAGFTGFP